MGGGGKKGDGKKGAAAEPYVEEWEVPVKNYRNPKLLQELLGCQSIDIQSKDDFRSAYRS